jgi:uncharacterized membrane protein
MVVVTWYSIINLLFHLIFHLALHWWFNIDESRLIETEGINADTVSSVTTTEKIWVWNETRK